MSGLEIGKIGRQLCDAAFEGVIRQLLEGYIVIGGTVAGQAGMYRQAGGIDLVWDLWNEQFSAFTYPEHALTSGSMAGASGGVHFGFGFGRFDSVRSAWSGEFYGVEYSVDIRAWSILSVSGSAQGFSSPEGTLKGGLVGIGGTAKVPGSLTKLLKLPQGGTVTAGGGVWTVHDGTTRQLAGRRRGDLERGRYSYLNLEEGELGVGSHMLQQVMGVSAFSLSLAGYAVAVAMAKRNMEDKGITDRAEGLRDLHLTLCSEAYRRIAAFRRDSPSGVEKRTYGRKMPFAAGDLADALAIEALSSRELNSYADLDGTELMLRRPRWNGTHARATSAGRLGKCDARDTCGSASQRRRPRQRGGLPPRRSELSGRSQPRVEDEMIATGRNRLGTNAVQ